MLVFLIVIKIIFYNIFLLLEFFFLIILKPFSFRNNLIIFFFWLFLIIFYICKQESFLYRFWNHNFFTSGFFDILGNFLFSTSFKLFLITFSFSTFAGTFFVLVTQQLLFPVNYVVCYFFCILIWNCCLCWF